MDDAGNVAVGNQANSRTGGADRIDDIGVARTIQHQRSDRRRMNILCAGETADVLGWRCVEIDHVFRITRTNRNFLHIDVRRIQKRAALRHRHGRNRARHVLGAKGRALERVDSDINFRTGVGADLFADEQHRRFVALTLANHHRTLDWNLVEFAPHGVHRSLVGSLFVAVAPEPRGGHRSALSHANDFECENAFQQKLRRNGNRNGHRLTPKTTNVAMDPADRTLSVLFDADDLRTAGYHPILLDGMQGLAHRIFSGCVRDEDDRHRGWLAACIYRLDCAIRMTLDDRFNGNFLLGKTRRDGRGSSRKIARHQANVITALMALHRRLGRGFQFLDRPPERRRANSSRHIRNIRKHGRGGRSTAGARAHQRDRRNSLAVDGHGVRDVHHLRDRG